METNKGREDQPQHNHPDEVNHREPGKEIAAQHKIDIVQSGLGRDQGQMPADEHIEHRFSQIDDETRNSYNNEASAVEKNDETQTSGYMNDNTSADRDTGNRNDGWEESRTARHK